MKTTTVRVEDRSRTDPAKVLSVRLDDLLRVLDKAADRFLIPCQGLLALGKDGCPDCRGALELKSELLKTASILRAEVQEKMKTGMPFGAKSKNEAKTEAKNRKRIK